MKKKGEQAWKKKRRRKKKVKMKIYGDVVVNRRGANWEEIAAAATTAVTPARVE